MPRGNHFARNRVGRVKPIGKTNSTVCCLAGRAAKGANPSLCAKKGKACAFLFLWRRESHFLTSVRARSDDALPWDCLRETAKSLSNTKSVSNLFFCGNGWKLFYALKCPFLMGLRFLPILYIMRIKKTNDSITK